MRALTLWQPWATLVALGAKRVETRSWAPRFRPPFRLAIHAARQVPTPGLALMADPRVREVLGRAGILTAADLPAGKVVAVCYVAAVRPGGEVVTLLDGPDLYLGDFRPGRWAWMLDRVTPLDPPVPARGRRQLWEWKAEGVPVGWRDVLQPELPFGP